MKTRIKRESLWQGIISHRLRPHSDWYRGGRVGEGRIVMTDENLQGADLRGVEGAKFERVDFSGAGINALEDVEVSDCTFDEAWLQRSRWHRAHVRNCRFHAATMWLSRFEDVVVDGGDWLGANLNGCSWTRARVTDARFTAATLVDARFDDATFVDCDFTRADFSRVDLGLDAARCPGTRFVRCDFRHANIDGLRFNGTTFDHCLFGGVRGKPDVEGDCTLIAPDFSPAGNGSVSSNGVPGIRDPEDVLRVWRERDADYLQHWYIFGNDTHYRPENNYPERRKG